VAFLFDTDAISELLRKRPAEAYLRWIRDVAPADQFASAITVGELYRGAFRAPDRERWLERIETALLPRLSVLPYDVRVARVYGEIRAGAELAGRMPGDADLMIAATALAHGLTLVTGNLRHFRDIPGLPLDDVLARARAAR
jgi:predicted nucleic acid-binding protein